MGRDTKKEKSDPSELEPALPKVKGDQVSAVIGEVGRWQLEKILIVFLAAAPGRDQSIHCSQGQSGNLLTSDNVARPRSHLPCRLHHTCKFSD